MALMSDGLLSSPSFVRDLLAFLRLPTDVLLIIADVGDEPDGFVGPSKAHRLNSLFDIPTNEASSILRITKHLYDKVTELRMDVDEAVNELDSVASGMTPPVVVDEQKREAIREVLSFKQGYEKSNTDVKALATGPHYTGSDGAWGIKLYHLRNGEAVKVPVMMLSIGWHDGGGGHNEVFFQMDDEDWGNFTKKIDALSDARASLGELLASS